MYMGDKPMEQEVDEKGAMDGRDLRILERLSTSEPPKCLSISQIAKELGLTRQAVHKRVKRLSEEGFVRKVGRCYLLTNKGKARLEFARSVERKYAMLFMEYFIGAVNSFEKNEKIGKPAIYLIIGFCIAYLLANVARISSLMLREADINKALNEMWDKELKEALKLVIYITTIIGEKGWDALKTFIDSIMGIAIFNSAIAKADIEKYSESP
jgi:DNA-binding Lrp family transcriptional regulator